MQQITGMFFFYPHSQFIVFRYTLVHIQSNTFHVIVEIIPKLNTMTELCFHKFTTRIRIL